MLRAAYLRKGFVQTFCWLRCDYPFAQTFLPENVRSIKNLRDHQSKMGGSVFTAR